MSRRAIQILLSIVLIAGSLTYMISTSLSEQIEYFYMADEVIAEPGKYQGQRIRLGGQVESGSIMQKPGTTEYLFRVKPVEARMQRQEAAGKTITVRFVGLPPDTFKDGADVIATGTLGGDGLFVAQDLLAKCPSKYEAAEKNAGTY